MALSDYKIQPGQITSKGVIAAPDKLTGTAAENKAVFDRLIREVVAAAVNGLVDGLTARTGAGEIGAAVSGLPGTDVQALLNSLKRYIDESVINAGAMVSFNDRNGRVLPQTGDYTADQITETGKHFITSAEREKWNMGNLESGSDEVGSYLKFPNGTMLEWGVVTVENVPAGGHKAGFVQFPVTFKSPPSITATAVADTAMGTNTTQIGSLTSRAVYIFVYNAISLERTVPIHWHAIGRWK